MATSTPVSARPTVSIIVPARNEEDCLGTCLESLVVQAGVEFEVLVVDDASTDRTRAIAQSFPVVKVIDPGPPPAGWSGKNNAVTAGARAARGEWFLFTDADTVHQPGSLARALKEASDQNADLLSYSPEQIAVTFWEMAVLPVVFAELARQYPPSKVSDPNSPSAAANGQYILVKRSAYEAVGGHAAVAGTLLEDVALARAVKQSVRRIFFRYAADMVRTRMYRNFQQMREGWTKNLALLFPRPGWLAIKTLLWWALPWITLFWPFAMHARPVTADISLHSWWWLAVAAVGAGFFLSTLARIRRAHFPWMMNLLGAFFGMPMFAYLLLRSKRAHAQGRVAWKGRTYSEPGPLAPSH